LSETELTLSGSAVWNGSTDPETVMTTTGLGGQLQDWQVTLTFSSTTKYYTVKLDGQHLINPTGHSDNAPGDVVSITTTFPKLKGTSSQAGDIYHNVVPGHVDSWLLTAKSNSKVDVTFTAEHVVPEPSTYALIAGLGLVGFAGYRRMRG